MENNLERRERERERETDREEREREIDRRGQRHTAKLCGKQRPALHKSPLQSFPVLARTGRQICSKMKPIPQRKAPLGTLLPSLGLVFEALGPNLVTLGSLWALLGSSVGSFLELWGQNGSLLGPIGDLWRDIWPTCWLHRKPFWTSWRPCWPPWAPWWVPEGIWSPPLGRLGRPRAPSRFQDLPS